ncbi:C4-dicarboxylate-binding protein DctP [Kroppenstedtia sanguinis]
MLTILSLTLLFFNPFFQTNGIYDDEQQGLNEQIVIKFSHVVAENTPKGLAAQKFAELASQKTNGKVKVDVFPNAVLYSDEEEMDALMQGDVQMIAPTYSNLTDFMPEWQVLDLPFIFRNHDDVERVFTGPVGNHLLKLLEEKNIKGMAFWSNGFKQMISNEKSLVHLEDFQGQTFRIMPSPVIEEQFQLFGGHPIPVPFPEVYQELETHRVDGLENTISNIFSKRFYQVQHYLTLSNHGYLGYAVLMNKPFWDQLPRPIQRQLSEAMEETTVWILKQSKHMNEQQFEWLKKQSQLEITILPEKEKQKWMEQMKPVYDRYRQRFGNQLLQEIHPPQ